MPIPPLVIPPASFGPICAATGLCASGAFAGPGVLIVQAFLQELVQVIRTVFIGVAALYFGWAALMLIVYGEDDATVTEQKRAFGHSAIGMGIIGIASLLVQTFAPSAVGTSLANPTPFQDAADRVTDYVTIATGAFLVFLIALAGFRIIVLQGNESEIEKQKKSFFNGLLGMVVLLLARIVVFTIVGAANGGALDALIREIAGVAKFLLEIVAGLAVISCLASGLFFLMSLGADERRQRAKRILSSTVIILIIVVTAHTLVATFIR